MRLEIGDELVCILVDTYGLTYGKVYKVAYVRESNICDDICIKDDGGMNWWFAQVDTDPDEWQCWNKWFVTKKEWDRDMKLNQLI
jgi:hypothetical protein